MVSSSWFRRHKKTVYIVMIFSMFVWGISYSAMEMIPKKPIGTIFGRKITENEFLDIVGGAGKAFFFLNKKKTNVFLLCGGARFSFFSQKKKKNFFFFVEKKNFL